MFGLVKVGIRAAEVVALGILMMVMKGDRQMATKMEVVPMPPDLMAVLAVLVVEQESMDGLKVITVMQPVVKVMQMDMVVVAVEPLTVLLVPVVMAV